MTAAMGNDVLAGVIRVGAPAVIFGAELPYQALLSAVRCRAEQAAELDCREGIDVDATRARLVEAARAKRPVVVLLGSVVNDALRALLSEALEGELVESEPLPPARIIALVPSARPPEALRRLFTLQLPAARVVEAG